MGKVEALFVYKEEGKPPTIVESGTVMPGKGLGGDRHAERSKRQLLASDAEVLASMGLAPGAVREQVSISGVAIDSLEPGAKISISGNRFEVVAPCAPCLTIGKYNGAEDVEDFREQLQGKRGVFIRLVEEGSAHIRVGDPVQVIGS